MCIHPELPGQFDGEEAAGSEDFHLCFGSVAGSGCGLRVVFRDSSIGRVAGIAVGTVEIVVFVAVSTVESVHSLLVVAVTVDYFESVGTAVVHAVFVCLAVAVVCRDMNSAGCPVFGIVGSEAAYNVVVVYTESLTALSLAVGTIWYFVCTDPIPQTDGAAKYEKNYESLLEETDCKDMVVV